jgi:Universal stress protein family
MMQIRQILAPTDFSECSKQSVSCAYELAQAFGAKLVLLHVIEALPSYIGFIPLGRRPRQPRTGTLPCSEGFTARLDSRPCKGDTWLMEDGNPHFLPGLQEGNGCIQHNNLWRCSDHGLFLHHQLWPREQKKVRGARTERKWNTHVACIHRQVTVTTCLAMTGEAVGSP